MADNVRYFMHCSHPDKKNPEKKYSHQIATVWLPQKVYDLMKKENLHIGVQPHDNPSADWVIFAPKDWPDDDEGGGKKKW